MKLEPDYHVSILPHVLHRDLGSETVLLDLDNGIYYGLDAVGTRLWSLLPGTPRLGDLHRRLIDEFDVTSEQLWLDLTDFLTRLDEKGLIHVGLEQTQEG